MKQILTITFLSISISLLSQGYNGYIGSYEAGVYYRGKGAYFITPFLVRSREDLVDNGVAEVKIFEVRKKGEFLSSQTSFDTEGNWKERIFYKHNGRKSQHWLAEWNGSKKMKRFERQNGKGAVLFLTTWEYNSDNRKTAQKTLKRGKPYNDGQFIYQDTLMTEAKYGRRGSEKKSRWTYTYYEGGSIRQSVYYNRKGKQKRIWSFACDEEGKQLQKKEMEVCKKTEIDENGNRKEVYQYTDEKLKIRKMVLTYDKDEHLLERVRYDKNDREVFRNTHVYNEKGDMISTAYFRKGKKKPMTNYVFEYNDNHLMVKETCLKKDMSPKWSYVRQYKTS